MSTFSGINLASRALAAAQRSMEVTGQNIANVNTEGYTRQRVEQTESIPGVGSTWARKNVAGDGVEITGIGRLADALADAAARQDAATAAEQKATGQVWTRVEDILDEPSGQSSLSAQLSSMYAAWNDLANAGTTNVGAARATVLARSQAVVDTAAGLGKQLSDQWFDLRGQLDSHVADVNATAQSIAGFNEAIVMAKATGASPNELIDKRDLALAHLTELTGARAVQSENGSIDVYIGNAAIVSGRDASAMAVTHGATLTDTKYAGERSAVTVGGVPTAPTAGTLKSALDAVNTTIPAVSQQIDDALRKVADTINIAYNPGRTPGATTDPGDLLVLPANGRDVASRLVVNSASVLATNFDTNAARETARTIASLPGQTDSPSATWRLTVVDFAAKSQAAQVRADLSAQVSLKSAAVRDATSGVSIDEEMTNLVAFQHAYTAAARVLTTIDQALDTLINRTGLVGR